MEWMFILASVAASFLVVIFFILIGKCYSFCYIALQAHDSYNNAIDSTMTLLKTIQNKISDVINNNYQFQTIAYEWKTN